MQRTREVCCGDTLNFRVVEDQVVLRFVNEIVGESDVFVFYGASAVFDR